MPSMACRIPPVVIPSHLSVCADPAAVAVMAAGGVGATVAAAVHVLLQWVVTRLSKRHEAHP
jgi:hypothetical protein